MLTSSSLTHTNDRHPKSWLHGHLTSLVRVGFSSHTSEERSWHGGRWQINAGLWWGAACGGQPGPMSRVTVHLVWDHVSSIFPHWPSATRSPGPGVDSMSPSLPRRSHPGPRGDGNYGGPSSNSLCYIGQPFCAAWMTTRPLPPPPDHTSYFQETAYHKVCPKPSPARHLISLPTIQAVQTLRTFNLDRPAGLSSCTSWLRLSATHCRDTPSLWGLRPSAGGTAHRSPAPPLPKALQRAEPEATSHSSLGCGAHLWS